MNNKVKGFKAVYAVTTEELQILDHSPEEHLQRRIKEQLLKDLVAQIEQRIDVLPVKYSRNEKGMYIEYNAALYFAEVNDSGDKC